MGSDNHSLFLCWGFLLFVAFILLDLLRHFLHLFRLFFEFFFLHNLVILFILDHEFFNPLLRVLGDYSSEYSICWFNKEDLRFGNFVLDQDMIFGRRLWSINSATFVALNILIELLCSSVEFRLFFFFSLCSLAWEFSL